MRVTARIVNACHFVNQTHERDDKAIRELTPCMNTSKYAGDS